MLTWRELVLFPEAGLAALDIAALNLACARNLPGSEGLEAGRCLALLDRWAAHVGRETDRSAGQFARDPAAFEGSWSFFRVLVLVTVMQEDLGVRYDPALVDRDDFFTQADNLFIHGPLRGRGGTCSSLPPLYVAVGRRLGYPLRLVATHSHLFARWDDLAAGERFNVECTSHGLNCHADDYYRTWPRPTTPEDVERYGLLVSQSPREELAGFLVNRGHCFLDNGRYGEAIEAFEWADALTERHRGYGSCVQYALGQWRDRWAESGTRGEESG